MQADSSEPRLRVALVGWGAIGTATAGYLADAPVEIVAVAVRDATGEREGLPVGARLISDPNELAGIDVDVVAEAAGRESVGPWGRAALALGADFIVSSVSAFADAALLEELRALAARHGVTVQIQPGALAGVDTLAAARHMGVDAVEHRMVKPPRAWTGTPAEELCDLEQLSESTVFFSASAAETARAFPKNANVAMTTALAGIGPDRTTISLVADPSATTNRHEITAHGPFGSLDVVIDNNPLPTNPKSSAMAALALVRAIENRATPLAI